MRHLPNELVVFTILLLLTSANIVGCGESMNSQIAKYVATHESAATGVPLALEFEEIFPGATDHFITHFAMSQRAGKEERTWNSLAYFGGRYWIQMQIPVIVDYDRKSVIRAGNPMFALGEFTQIENRNGQVSASSRSVARFGEAEWNKIYQSKGDFSSVGLKSDNKPHVPGFEMLVQNARQPMLPITLLGKKEMGPSTQGNSQNGQ